MSYPGDAKFSSHDDSAAPSEKPTYALPLEEWNQMVELANHLGQREAEMPLRRRMETFLQASNQASFASLLESDQDQRED